MDRPGSYLLTERPSPSLLLKGKYLKSNYFHKLLYLQREILKDLNESKTLILAQNLPWLLSESLNVSGLVITVATNHFSVTKRSISFFFKKYLKFKETFHWIYVDHLNYSCTRRTLLSHSSPGKLQPLVPLLLSPQLLNPSVPAPPLAVSFAVMPGFNFIFLLLSSHQHVNQHWWIIMPFMNL